MTKHDADALVVFGITGDLAKKMTLRARVGERARGSLLGEVERGAYVLEVISRADVARAREVIEHHRDLGISLADASIVVLAEQAAQPPG